VIKSLVVIPSFPETFNVANMPAQQAPSGIIANGTAGNSVGNGTTTNHCVEFNSHYSDIAGQDDIESFLFTSESVSEGHPGINALYVHLIDALGIIILYRA